MKPSHILVPGILCGIIVAEAAALRVPSDYPTVGGALAAAQNGDTVLVADGTYYETMLQTSGKAIVLRSENGPRNCTLNGYRGNMPVFVIEHGETSSTVIQGFTIRGVSGEPATGISVVNSSPMIVGNIFTGNYGTAIDCYQSSPIIVGNLIVENGNALGEPNMGGGIYAASGARPLVVGNTIAHNEGFVGGVLARDDADAVVLNCIIWGNMYNGNTVNATTYYYLYDDRDGSLNTTPAYSLIGGLDYPPESSNFNLDPEFVHVDANAHLNVENSEWVSSSDFRLRSTSPCVDAGSNGAVPEDVTDGDHDGNFTEALPYDLNGKRRISGINVDVGCYEFQHTIMVAIDIKPGSGDNSVNLGSQGLIPVAILSSTTFDATKVEPSTVFLAGAGVAIRGKGNNYLYGTGDVNGDGLADLTVHVETENLDPEQLQNGHAVIVADTREGDRVTGSDNITIVPR